MLRRPPTTSDGKVVDRLSESTRVNKPFKPPTVAKPVERVQPQRKRKRVSYAGQQNEDSDSDDDGNSKKKKKSDGGKDKDGIYHNEDELWAMHKKYPVYKPKPFDQITRRFSLPTMRSKDGSIVPLVPTGASLGTRPPAKIIPRPLHDPMEDHAIVLYDPTIDDRETDEERQERLKQEAKEKAEQEAKEKTAGLYNPHKSLKKLLGETEKDKAKVDKVPVVIDPRLSKVLRPHQVEGVKVRITMALGSTCTQVDLAVLVSLYNRYGRGEPVWVYHGRRDGSRKDAAVYSADVDTPQTITTPWKTDNREMYYRMPLQFGQELGQRTQYVSNCCTMAFKAAHVHLTVKRNGWARIQLHLWLSMARAVRQSY
jgi:hypothetical protein